MKKALLLLCFILLSVGNLFAAGAGELSVYNWTEYIPEEVIKQFEKETGIKVRYATYETNEEMYEKIKAANSSYDLIFPSSYYIARLAKENLIAPMDLEKVHNLFKINPVHLNQYYDGSNKYSLPFVWGSTGIAVNKKYINPSKITKWADLWNEEFKGKIMLQDDMREVFQMALKVIGRRSSSRDEGAIKLAYEKLKELKPNIKVFETDSPKTPLLNGDVHIGMIWSGEAFAAASRNSDIVYIYPSDGAILWGDNFAITKNAKNVENAYKFIDFLLRPEISAKIVNAHGYSSPILPNELKSHLTEKAKKSNIIFPSIDNLKNAEWQIDIRDALPIYEKYWKMFIEGK